MKPFKDHLRIFQFFGNPLKLTDKDGTEVECRSLPIIVFLCILHLVCMFGLLSIGWAVGIALSVRGKSMQEIYAIFHDQNISNWELLCQQVMLYPNILRPFGYLFFWKSDGQAQRMTEFAKQITVLEDETEGV